MDSISKWTSLIASASLHCRFNAAEKFCEHHSDKMQSQDQEVTAQPGKLW